MKAYKQVILVLSIVAASVAAIFSALFGTNKKDLSIYLDATNFVESKESKEFRNENPLLTKRNAIENSFLGSSYDNYSLYKYKYDEWSLTRGEGFDNKGKPKYVPEEQKYESINDAMFSGDIASYDKVVNDAMNVDVGNNDFQIVNLVIKTKDKFSNSDNLKVKINTDEAKQYGLEISSGFLRNIVANASMLSEGWPLQSGVTKDLIVPDGITSDKSVAMVKNKVYVYRIRIDRKDNKITNNKDFKLKLEIKNNDNSIPDFKQINVHKINKDLTFSKDDAENPSFNILDYPNSMAYFYNNYGTNKNDIDYFYNYKSRIRDEKGNVALKYDSHFSSFDENNMEAYVDFNGDHYGNKEFSYQKKYIGNGSYFLVNFSHDGNHPSSWDIDDNGRYTKSNLGDEDRDGNSYFIGKINEDGLYLDNDDGKATDDFIFKMNKLGFKNILLNDLLKMSYYSQTFFIKNSLTNKGEKKDLSVDPKDTKATDDKEYGYSIPSGQQLMQEMIEAGVKHIEWLKADSNNYQYNWVNNDGINSSFYVDESDANDIKAIIKIMNNVKSKYEADSDFLKLNVAYPIRFMNDKQGSGTDAIKDVDILYLYTSSLYVDGNERVKSLIKYRNEHKLITGMYQLNSSANNDLLRCEPGTLDYEMLLLNKQGEPNYMKYNIARWNSADNYGSASFWEPEWYKVPYASGDVVGEYPDISSVDANGIKKSSVELNKDFESLGANKKEINVIPSVRLEQLALGNNTVRKIQILKKENKIDEDNLNKNINVSLTGSVIQSKYKFVFDNSLGEIPRKDDSFLISYISNYLRELKLGVGQVDAVKIIQKLIDEIANTNEGDKQ